MTNFFLHIPKTAGRSVTAIIARNYPEHRRFAGQQAGLFFPDDRKEQAPLDGKTKQPIDVASLPRENAILTGHIPYDCIADNRERFRVFTILRDPVDRLISEYNHAATAPHHYLHKRIVEGSLSFSDYCLEDFVLTSDNIQTRFVSGCGFKRGFGEVTKADLRDAERHLMAFEVFGLQERFAESLSLIAAALGWKPETLCLERVGHNEKVIFREDLDDELVTNIKKKNAFDVELCETATAIFNQRVKEARASVPEAYWAIPHDSPLSVPARGKLGATIRSIWARFG